MNLRNVYTGPEMTGCIYSTTFRQYIPTIGLLTLIGVSVYPQAISRQTAGGQVCLAYSSPADSIGAQVAIVTRLEFGGGRGVCAALNPKAQQALRFGAMDKPLPPLDLKPLPDLKAYDSRSRHSPGCHHRRRHHDHHRLGAEQEESTISDQAKAPLPRHVQKLIGIVDRNLLREFVDKVANSMNVADGDDDGDDDVGLLPRSQLRVTELLDSGALDEQASEFACRLVLKGLKEETTTRAAWDADQVGIISDLPGDSDRVSDSDQVSDSGHVSDSDPYSDHTDHF